MSPEETHDFLISEGFVETPSPLGARTFYERLLPEGAPVCEKMEHRPWLFVSRFRATDSLGEPHVRLAVYGRAGGQWMETALPVIPLSELREELPRAELALLGAWLAFHEAHAPRS